MLTVDENSNRVVLIIHLKKKKQSKYSVKFCNMWDSKYGLQCKQVNKAPHCLHLQPPDLKLFKKSKD